VAYTKHSVGWTAKWNEQLITDAWRSTKLVERTRGGFSTAHHELVFQDVKGRAGEFKQLANLLRSSVQVQFKFVNTEGKESVEHKHIVHSYVGEDSVSEGDAYLSLTTVQESALLNLVPLFRAWKGSSTLDIAEQCLGESGYSIGQHRETPSRVQEFEHLVQAGCTAWQFVESYLIPRSATNDGFGGFRLFSTDGKDLAFCTPKYGGAPKAMVDMRQITNFRVKGATWDVIRNGGLRLELQGFDPVKGAFMNDRLELLPAGIPTIDGLRARTFACRTKEGMRAMGAAHQGITGWDIEGWFLYAHGSDLIGDQKLQLPLRIDLSSTPLAQRYYQRDQLTGWVNSITHQVGTEDVGGYSVIFDGSSVPE
jgi:hypothetical protein